MTQHANATKPQQSRLGYDITDITCTVISYVSNAVTHKQILGKFVVLTAQSHSVTNSQQSQQRPIPVALMRFFIYALTRITQICHCSVHIHNTLTN